MIDILGAIIMLQSCVSSVSNFLTAPYTSWFPIVVTAALAVLSILAVIFVLSPLLGRNDIRSWVRVKMYEVLLSIALVMIFGAFATELCTFNPVPAFERVQLVVPSQCGSTSGTGIDNIYGLAVCDMYNFKLYNIELNQYIYYVAIAFSTAGKVTFSLELLPGVEWVNPDVLQQDGNGVEGFGLGGEVGLMPIDTTVSLGGAFIVLGTLYILNEIQLLLLGASVLLFAIFMAIGLIARMFGITRSFGGMMIALGLGIGFVYPLITAMTYGFIDYGLSNTGFGGCAPGQVICGAAIAQATATAFGAVVFFISAQLANSIPLIGTLIGNLFAGTLVIYIGLVLVGLTLIPLLNFLVVDTFVEDMSAAIGERVDFLSLLERII